MRVSPSISFLAVVLGLGACSGGSGGGPDGAGPGVDGAGSDGGGPDAATCVADTQHDPANCGRCGHSCGGGTCSQGLCDPVLVLDAPEEPFGPTVNELATFVDQGQIYEFEYTTTLDVHYVVRRAPTTPTDPASQGTVIQDVPGSTDIDAAAFDATYVWEAVEGSAAGVNGQVARKRLDGSEGTGLATRVFSLPPDRTWKNLAVTADAVYLTGTTTLNGPGHPEPDTTAFYRMALAAVTSDGLAQPTAIASLDARGDLISDLTVVGGHLFWTEYDLGSSEYEVFTAPVGGGAPVHLGTGTTRESSFASDGTSIFWTEVHDGGAIMQCPLDHLDAAHVAPLTTVDSAREGILVRGGQIYVMELPDPRPVSRVAIANGAVELLGDMEVPPSEKGTRVIGIDADFLYMTTTDAKVWRFPNAP